MHLRLLLGWLSPQDENAPPSRFVAPTRVSKSLSTWVTCEHPRSVRHCYRSPRRESSHADWAAPGSTSPREPHPLGYAGQLVIPANLANTISVKIKVLL